MYLHPRFRRLGLIIVLASLIGTLYACGQKGDLYLPDDLPERGEEEKR